MRDWQRLWRHANTGEWSVRRSFPPQAQRAIEIAIDACEARAAGEVRFAIEDSLPLTAVWRGVTPRQRAIDKFAELRVWDTARNDGVLIYLLLADHDVEIVADRGLAQVPAAEWEACCRVMEQRFRAGEFGAGAREGIEAVAAVLARHASGSPAEGNELPNRPIVL